MNAARVLPYIVAGTFFMENLDGTVIATALPQMGVSFGVGPADLSIGMTAYLLTLAVFIPVSGWVAERFGARAVFASAIALFTAASLACGFAIGLDSFILARVVQGIGGAMMVPVGRMAVLRTTPREGLVRAINTITWPGLLAPILGPPVGGFLTTYATWRWIFWLNLPVGLFALLVALRFVPAAAGTARPFDRIGFILTGAALAGSMYGLDELGRAGANPGIGAAIVLAALLTGAAAVWHLRRHPSPLLNLSPTAIPTMRMNLLAGSAFRIAFNTFPFLVPLLLQVGFGMTAFHAGQLILVGAAGDMAVKSALPWLYRRYGFRTVLMASGLFGIGVILALASLRPGTPDAVIALVLLAYGVARSVQFGATNTLGFADIPAALTAPASTLTSMIMQTTTGMGIAFGAVALHSAVWLHGGDPLRPVIADFRLAILASGVVAALAWLGYRRLDPAAGAAVSGHEPGRLAPR